MRTVLVLEVKSTPAPPVREAMMAAMDPADRADPGPFWPAARVAVSGAVVVFVLATEKNRHLRGWFVLFPAAAVAGVFAARHLPVNRTLAVIGAVVAVTAAWLVAQRDDAAVVAILAFGFGLGTGLAIGLRNSPFPRSPAHAARAVRIAVGATLVVGAALTIVAPQNVMLWVAALLVVTGTVATSLGRFPTGTTSRVRALVFGTVLVATTLIVTGYVGAETPDATWFGGGTVHGPTNGNEVALTFDDGPNLGATEQIMAILDAHGVKGTFFEVGKAIDKEPQITRALYADGQLLGNHSYHHDQWRWLDPRYPELARTQAAFERAIGTCPVLYRPPHGDRTPFLAQVVRDHHMHMVLWSASAGDWATGDAQLVARRILAGARPGAILLLHDGLDGNPAANRSVLVRALPLILDGLKAKGLSPVRLDKLLGAPAYQHC